jgi:hypothetical protein
MNLVLENSKDQEIGKEEKVTVFHLRILYGLSTEPETPINIPTVGAGGACSLLYFH